MKRLVLNLATGIVGGLMLMGMEIGTAQAYWATAPKPVTLNQTGQPWYITSSEDGTRFYGGNNFYHQMTYDDNLFVTGLAITLNTNGSASGMYMQIDCGRFLYKPLTPWVTVTPGKWKVLDSPTTSSWKHFSSNSAFEVVGRQFCEDAANHRGFTWVWF